MTSVMSRTYSALKLNALNYNCPQMRIFGAAVLAILVAPIFGWLFVPQFGISVVFALVASVIVLVVLARPIFGFYILVFTMPIQNVILVEGVGATWTMLVGILVISVWVLQRLVRKEPWSKILSSKAHSKIA